MFARVAAAAEAWGALNLQWQTPSWNEGAVRFYRRLGASAEAKLRFTLGPEGCRALLTNPARTPPPAGELA